MNALVSWPVARATLRERGLAPWSLVPAVAAVLMSAAVSSQSPFFGMFVGAPFVILTMLLGGALLAGEIQSGHAQLVLLRPITRAQWVGGRLAGAVGVLSAVAIGCLVAGGIASLVRAGFPSPALAVAFTWLQAMAWLATLLAIGAAAPGWTNAGFAIAGYVGWNLLRLVLTPARPEWAATLSAIDAYVGPQDLIRVAVGYSRLERAAWDVLWFFAAWLVAVRVFNLRELARRRT